jgi:hypothetical protein
MAAGKYSHITPHLPPKQPDDADYQKRVDDAKVAIVERTASTLAERYAALRVEKDAADDALSAINLQLEATTQLIVDQFEQDGLTSVKLDGGQSVTVGYEPYSVVSDRDALWEWGMDPNQGNMARAFTLNWQLLNSLVKDLLLKGEPEPPGVTATSRSKITFRRR